MECSWFLLASQLDKGRFTDSFYEKKNREQSRDIDYDSDESYEPKVIPRFHPFKKWIGREPLTALPNSVALHCFRRHKADHSNCHEKGAHKDRQEL